MENVYLRHSEHTDLREFVFLSYNIIDFQCFKQDFLKEKFKTEFSTNTVLVQCKCFEEIKSLLFTQEEETGN